MRLDKLSVVCREQRLDFAQQGRHLTCVTSRMKAAASRTSSSSFADRGCIYGLARLIDRLDEVRISERSDHNQIDSAAKQSF